jgi:type IV pilus assembly protein PilX
MNNQVKRILDRQHGMALISGLLLLLVITIIGVSMFRSFGIQAKIAGNTREKQRALHAAEAAQAYAEWWVSAPGGGNATLGDACTTVVTVTKPTDVTVCNSLITASTLTSGPWTSNGDNVGFKYQPDDMPLTGTGAYWSYPMFYIAYVSNGNAGNTQLLNYRIDAMGSGGTSNTVSVVESTYQVGLTYTTQSSNEVYNCLTCRP